MTTLGNLVGTNYRKLDGSLDEGSVYITTNIAGGTLRDPAGNVIWSGSLEVPIVDGTFAITLPPTDDETLSADGFVYIITERLKSKARAQWRVASTPVPGGTTVNMADLASGTVIPASPGEEPVELATFLALQAEVADLPDSLSSVGEVRSQARPDDGDQRATLLAELTALEAAGGGTLVLPSGIIEISTNDLTLPNDGADPVPSMNSIRIVGQGSQWASRGAIDPQGGTVLHFTGAAGAHAAIRTNGVGLFQLADLTMQVDNGHFIHTTNTVLRAVDNVSFIGGKSHALCDQDVFIFGGTQQVEGGDDWDDGFQGYGSAVIGCFFNNIRRAFYGRAFCNGVVVRDNTIWNQCGSNLAGGAAIEIDGRPTTGGQTAAGNVIEGNLIEIGAYVYGIKLDHAIGTSIRANNAYDSNPGVTVAVVRLESAAVNNLIELGYFDAATIAGASEVNPDANTVVNPFDAGGKSHHHITQRYQRGIETTPIYSLGPGAPEITLDATQAFPARIFVLRAGSTPEGVITANGGSLCFVTGVEPARLYFKATDTAANIGWIRIDA